MRQYSRLIFLMVVLMVLFGANTQTQAQCNNSTSFGSASAPTTTTPTTISTCVFRGDYSTITGVVAGQSYQIGLSCASGTTYITVRHTTPGGTFVGNGAAPYSFIAPVSGTYYIHYNTNAACGTVTGCCTATITCTSCTPALPGCTNNWSDMTLAAPTNNTTTTIGTCTWQDEYNTITGMAAGSTYSFGSSCGGYITIHSGTYNGPIVASGNAPLSYTPTSTGTYYIHYNTNSSCGTAMTCCNTTITCTSCTGGGGGGCTNSNAFGSASAPTNNTPLTISSCTFQTEYNTITGVVAGQTYQSTSSCGGYITVRFSTPGGTVVAQGNSPLTWTATSSGTHYIHYNTNASCGTASTCCTTTLTCTSCSGGAGNPCASITPITNCNQSIVYSVSGSGTWSTGSCFWSTPGNEVIYSFTATSTGAHLINISGYSGSFTHISYVNATSGCSSGAPWTCIDDVIMTGNTPSFNLVAGQTYYFLFDAETTPATAMTFSIQCPSGSVVTASDCAQAVNICDNANFAIDPNGSGAINEIPALGGLSNPDYGWSVYNPWGTTNYGCLRAGELNSTWMVINVSGSGMLQFSFGAGGAQAGFYDWAMWPYNATACDQVRNNLIAPVRCNWNGSSTGGTGLASPLPVGGNATNYEPPLAVTAGQQFLICFSNYSSATTNVPLNFFGTATVSCNPLQVEMLNFKGIHSNGINQLTWMTSAEYNSLKFDIERSEDGINFIKVGEMAAAGLSSTPTPYQFNDVQAPVKTVFYRLKQWNTMQGYEFSNAISIAPDGLSSFGIVSAWPNPAKDHLNLSILSPVEGNFEIRITDMQGRSVSSQFVNITSNVNEVRIPITGINKGLYQVLLIDHKTGLISAEKIILTDQGIKNNPVFVPIHFFPI